MDRFRRDASSSQNNVPPAGSLIEQPKAVDRIIDGTLGILETGGDAVEAAQVPGLAAAVKTLTLILQKLKASRVNQTDALKLCTRIRVLSESVVAAQQAIGGAFRKFPDESSTGQSKLRRKLEESTRLSKRVDDLQLALSNVLDTANQLHLGRSSLDRWYYSRRDADILKALSQKVEEAKEKFELPGRVSMEAQINDIVTKIEDLRRAAAQRDLRRAEEESVRRQEEYRRAEEERVRRQEEVKRAQEERIRRLEEEKLAEEERILESIPRAEDAHFRAAANAMKARFQPGTREQLLDALENWERAWYTAQVTVDARPVCVLVGEAGTGKSTVASEFAKRLHGRDRLGASFFFTRGVQDLSSPKKFFATLASQLARSQSTLRVPVVDAVREHRKTAVLQQLEHEFENLIAKPLRALPADHPPIFVIVDALDECTEDGPQLVPELLRLLLLCAVQPGSPLRVFLTSRPEPYYIHKVFTIADLEPHISTVRIQDFRSSVDHDIEALIRNMLDKDEASRQWYNDDPSIVPGLTCKAEGLFIYARTAVEFILGDMSSLQERYTLLLSIQPRPYGLAPIDTLYLIVLESVFPRHEQYPLVQERLKRVLGYLVALQEPDGISPMSLQRLTNMAAAESVAILNKLRSVVFFERDNVDSPFRILHATFREFLTDASRCSNTFYVDSGQVHGHLAGACIKAIRECSTTYWGGTTGAALLLRVLVERQNETWKESFPELRYAHMYLDHHRKHASSDFDFDSQLMDDDVPLEASLVRYWYSDGEVSSQLMAELIEAVLQHLHTSAFPNGKSLLYALSTLNHNIGRLRDEQVARDMQIHWVGIIIDIQAIATASEESIPGMSEYSSAGLYGSVFEELARHILQTVTAVSGSSNQSAMHRNARQAVAAIQDGHTRIHMAVTAAGLEVGHSADGHTCGHKSQ